MTGFEGHPYEKQIGMVPTTVAHGYREYDRRVPHALVEDIRRNGIKEPLILNYSKNTGEAMFGEGNHRLAVAMQLGISHVPVRVLRQHGAIQPNGPGSRGGRPVPAGVLPGNKHGYLPQDMHPRDLGLPVR